MSRDRASRSLRHGPPRKGDPARHRLILLGLSLVFIAAAVLLTVRVRRTGRAAVEED